MEPKPVLARVAPIAIAAVVAAVLAACGGPADPETGGDDLTPPRSGSPAATATAEPTPATLPTVEIPPVKGPHNDIDSMFVTDMIPHHRQAIEMAELAGTRAHDPRVKAIAGQIEKTQDDEVTLMVGWLKSWGEPVPAPDKMHTSHGPGMMTHAEMEDLKAAEGAEFDRLFADMMVRHHEGALEMAETTKAKGQNPAVLALATNVVITQTAEVGELTAILDSL